jgi:hypothetical protein
MPLQNIGNNNNIEANPYKNNNHNNHQPHQIQMETISKRVSGAAQ